ncbi:MAG: phosphoribosylanthranilate isomerase [Methanomicrobiaceae archaeon]|nr:phosphoribosylanthranilate isomerase [Methanomicrobiaceae archaeon]
MTTPEDARLCASAGADCIGVVLCSDSPRSVSPGKARRIFDAVPDLARVAVTHSTQSKDLEKICAIRPDAIQVTCAARIPEECRALVIRMVGPGDATPADAEVILVDASHGRGRPYDGAFASAMVAASEVPVLLAGGLSPENVANAIRAVRPSGVDVATGVEYAPGKKDPERVKRFVRMAKQVIP